MRDKRLGILQIVSIIVVIIAIGVVVYGQNSYNQKIKASYDNIIVEEKSQGEIHEEEIQPSDENPLGASHLNY